MSEIIDRCRLAVIHVIHSQNLPVGTYIDSESIVRAVIEAMRSPTSAMVENSKQYMDSYSSNLAWWGRMIDEALGK